MIAETLKRIGRIEQQIADTDALYSLMAPLCKHLLPMSYEADLNGDPREGRSIELPKEAWPKQFDKGVNRCVGFDITWV